MKLIKLIAVLLLVSFPLASQGNMFNFLKKNNYIISPEISGHLTQDGQVLAGMDVYLEGGFLKNRYHDNAKTDLNGRFYFEPIVHSQWLKKNPLNQAYSYIGIYIIVEREKVYLWESLFSYDEPYDIIINNLTNLNCNVNSTEYKYYFKNPVVPDGVDMMLLSRCEVKGYKSREKNQED
ncbi:DUF6795 domain-containing protein [Vibrio metschnikovii]|uniref:DUF6795 domain-containing protein n=1 Tax=Vibrio metschnikovii TaxID=28172 RepID=UPI001C30246D|nr:DUF6795 domain-containing protein [Vibrio metschnikovii]EKO3565478.1 hypothetical protein [Vibrio metschnikovii]EKO3769058.1 hypothetical protein [Vibrio metschnikovii]